MNKELKQFDMGMDSTCTICNKRFCICPPRQSDGSWKPVLEEEKKYEFENCDKHCYYDFFEQGTCKECDVKVISQEPMIEIVCKCGEKLQIKGNNEWKIDAPKGHDWKFEHNCGWSVFLPKDVISEEKLIINGDGTLGSNPNPTAKLEIKEPMEWAKEWKEFWKLKGEYPLDLERKQNEWLNNLIKQAEERAERKWKELIDFMEKETIPATAILAKQMEQNRIVKEIEDRCAESFNPYCGGDKEEDISCFNKLQKIIKNI